MLTKRQNPLKVGWRHPGGQYNRPKTFNRKMTAPNIAPDITRLKLDRTASPPPRRRKVWLAAALLVIVIALLVWVRGTPEPEVELTTATTAYPYQNAALLNASGYVVAQRKAAVSTKASGRLEWLGVQEGSKVARDQVIARLDARDVAAQAEQAQANVGVARAAVEQAQAEFADAEAAINRAEDLAEKNFISPATLDAAQARFNKARAGLTSARAALTAARAAARAAEVAVEQTQIRAPFDGVVLTKNANLGDILTPFSSAAESKGAVVTMADMSTLEVEADVSESNLGKIRVGQPCEIQLDALPDERFRARVSRLVPTVDRTKATVMTKVEFLDRDPRILPEMAAKVVFLARAVSDAERVPRVVVSAETLANRAGKPVVFALSGTTVRAVAVSPADKINDAVVVPQLAAGTRVVLRPSEKLADGARVSVARKQP